MSPGCLAMSVWWLVRVCVCYAFVITVRRFLRVRGRVCIYAETMYRASGVRIGIRTRCVYTTGVYKKVIQN